MSPTSRNILLSGLVLILVMCLCLGALGLGGASVGILSPFLVTPAPSRPSPVSGTAVPGLPAATPPAGQAELPSGVAEQMDAIQQQVIQIRGLQPAGPVARVLLTRDQLVDKVKNEFFKDYTRQDAQDDQAVLAAFGLLSPGTDLYSLYQQLYSEQISGYYDNETKQMVVVKSGSFAGPERMTYAHEYTHALQDQNYNIREGLGYSDEKCKQESERCAGIQALIEGDATLVEMEWLQTQSTPLDKEQIQRMAQGYTSPVFDAAPAFLQQDFLFPYRSGQEFVQSLYDRGGWAAVDQAYRSPPVSSEQILHPDRYPADQPLPVSLPDLTQVLGSGWRKVDQNLMGEWYTFLMLAYGQAEPARLPAAAAQTAADGWGGDQYAVYANDQEGATVAVLVTRWDQPRDAVEYQDAFLRYGRSRWGRPASDTAGQVRWQAGSAAISFMSQGQQTTWVSAPNEDLLNAVLQVIK